MVARIVSIVLLTGCGVLILGERGTPADEKPSARTVVVGVGKWTLIEMTTKKQINRVETAPESIIECWIGGGGKDTLFYKYGDGKSLAEEVPAVKPKTIAYVAVRNFIAGCGPRCVGIGGVKPGKTIMTLTDEDNKVEIVHVEVRRELALPQGITYTLQSPSTKPIDKVAVDDAKIVAASRDGNGKAVQIESLALGETTLRVTDTAGKTEPVVVQVRKPTLMLTEGEQKKMQMMKKQVLNVIANDNDRVLNVRPATDDPSTVVIDAVGPGISNLVLVGIDKTQESFEVGVKPKGK